ncbi:MAG: hypothetical protein ACE5JU_04985 [Candidatus Binatia bacterium]
MEQHVRSFSHERLHESLARNEGFAVVVVQPAMVAEWAGEEDKAPDPGRGVFSLVLRASASREGWC